MLWILFQTISQHPEICFPAYFSPALSLPSPVEEEYREILQTDLAVAVDIRWRIRVTTCPTPPEDQDREVS